MVARNEEVLTQLEVAFDEAIERGNIEEARRIIVEVKNLDLLSGKILEQELLDAPLLNFINPTHEILWQ